MRACGLVCAMGVVLLCAVTAQAELLNLVTGLPWVYSSNIYVTYDADGGGGCGLLQADGWSMQAVTETETVDLWDGVFDLDIVIDPATGEAVSGSVLVTGDLNGYDTVTLFESTVLRDFGYGGDDLFEATFIQEGNTDMIDHGFLFGVILDGRTIADPWTFAADFCGDGFAKSDTAIPEPATLCLLGAGASLALIRRRRA